jgi:hypothetical protein
VEEWKNPISSGLVQIRAIEVERCPKNTLRAGFRAARRNRLNAPAGALCLAGRNGIIGDYGKAVGPRMTNGFVLLWLPGNPRGSHPSRLTLIGSLH